MLAYHFKVKMKATREKNRQATCIHPTMKRKLMLGSQTKRNRIGTTVDSVTTKTIPVRLKKKDQQEKSRVQT